MRLHKTGHAIADAVSDLIGELPNGDYKIAYGILRHRLFENEKNWFEIDKGFWSSGHYDGNYRLSFTGTQPAYSPEAPHEPHGLTFEPWRYSGDYALICPPTSYVCDFFRIDYASWLMKAIAQCPGIYRIRQKGEEWPIEWNEISRLITFNSTLGIEALRRGIPVVSDPVHSSIGSYSTYTDSSYMNSLDMNYRERLFCFLQAHQFKLSQKEKICGLIRHYLYSSDTIPEKPLPPTSPSIQYKNEPPPN